MNKLVVMVVMIAIGLTLTGCNIGTSKLTENQPPKQQETADKNPNQPNQEQPKPATESPKPRELTKKLEVLVEGERELREAKLAKSDELGYSIYVLKGFSLESEEPGKDVVLSDYDGEFFARVEKLDAKISLNQYQAQQKSAYEQVGMVTSMDPTTLAQQEFRDAKYCFLVESGGSKDQQKTNIIVLVKEFKGKLYAITLFTPLKEGAEGLTPSLWAMLATIEPN